jgi:hypothetical protein
VETCPRPVSVSSAHLEEEVSDHVERLLHLVAHNLGHLRDRAAAERAEHLERIAERRADVARRLERLEEDRLDGAYDDDRAAFIRQHKDLAARRDALDAERSEVETGDPRATAGDVGESLERVLHESAWTSGDVEARRDLLRIVLERVDVLPTGRIGRRTFDASRVLPRHTDLTTYALAAGGSVLAGCEDCLTSWTSANGLDTAEVTLPALVATA